MAVKYFCDKCGKELRDKDDWFYVTVKRGPTPPSNAVYSVGEFNAVTCGDCVKKIGFTID